MELKDLIKNSLSSEQDDPKDRLRIIQELVPGKQITLAHVIASPDPILYNKLGLNPELDFTGSAIGILTVSPAETAIIAADIATKAAEVEIDFLDRFTGSVILSGDVQSVQTALEAVTSTLQTLLGFDIVPVTKT